MSRRFNPLFSLSEVVRLIVISSAPGSGRMLKTALPESTVGWNRLAGIAKQPFMAAVMDPVISDPVKSLPRSDSPDRPQNPKQ